jgi:hypothetical protein
VRRVFLALLLVASPALAEELFVDRAAEWGLVFRYETGATGKLYYPEIVAGGAALFDFDDDGDLDVFFAQGKPLEAGAPPAAASGGRLFRNELEPGKTPRFVDVTRESGIRADGYGTGVATGDVDHDGRVDLYLLGYGASQLWRNRGDGTFEEATARAGVGASRLSLSASFADLDRDGWLDLFVAEYVAVDLQRHPTCYAPSSRRDYCGPRAFEPVPDRLYRNRGDGTFEDLSLRTGVAKLGGAGMGVVAADFDGDGWQDVLVANDGMVNFLWRNRHDGTFEEAALAAGAALDGDGRELANMGIAVGDPDDDGDWDLLVTHLDGETNTLWTNDGAGNFSDRTAAAGLAAPSLAFTGFGAGWLDVENDGRLDLFVANGAVHLLEEQAQRGDPFPFRQTPQLFRGLGGGRFADASATAGAAFRQAEVGRGVAVGDVDNDGDADVLVVAAGGPARLLVNEAGSAAPWLGLRLVGQAAGARAPRDQLGARVGVVRRGAPTLWRRAATDGSYASASDPRVLVGLGDGTAIAEVRVDWPDGASEAFPAPPLRRYTTLAKGTGRPLAAQRSGKQP